MIRVKKKWNQANTSRTIPQMANAIAGNCFKLSAEVVLNLENENFETTTQTQRIDVMEEMVCFLVHVVDRYIYSRGDEKQRSEFISALVTDLARLLEDSRFDVQGEASYQAAFIDKANARSSDYARFSFSEQDGSSFAMRCQLGNRVQASMGERDSKWIPDYVIGREAPEIESSIIRSLKGLVEFSH
jgi:hypothetical protein